MRKGSKSKRFESEAKAPRVSLTRRELIQAAAWVTGGGLLAGGVLEPKVLLADPAAAPSSYLTKDRIASTPTFKYRPYRSKQAATPDTTSWVQIDLGEPRS